MTHPTLILTATTAWNTPADFRRKAIAHAVVEDVLGVGPNVGRHIAVDIGSSGVKQCDRLAVRKHQTNHPRPIHPRERFPRTGQRGPFVRDGGCELTRLEPLVVVPVSKELADVVAVEQANWRDCLET